MAIRACRCRQPKTKKGKTVNQTILKGNLTRDVELRYTPKGTSVAQFGVAVNRKWTTEDGEKKEEVTFLDVEAWGRIGEVIAQYFTKGKPIIIRGRLKQEQWEDKTTSQKRSKIKVVLEEFDFCGDSKGSGEPAGQPSGGKPTARRTTPEPSTDTDTLPQEVDDVPF